MRLPRLSIGKLLALIGIVALDLAIGRALAERDDLYLLGLGLSGPVIQLGLILAIFRRGSSRLFWIGFVSTASLAAGSFIFYVEQRPESDALSAIAWDAYLRFIHFNLISVYEDGFRIQLVPDPPSLVLAKLVAPFVIFSLPQLLAALCGGWLLVFVSRFSRSAVRSGDHRDGSALNQPNSIGADEPMSAEATSVGVGD